ncbi:disease resistance protein RGH2 [Striga asiatica]|uniref:Disease resistance protein RGH2 n=1 Tax=Striga asiatica TaxID=4170 RepID=A0A5A7R8J6_STRAF|nr:disease resistance protein RGH2 [Striga asiatica]
MLLLPLRMTRMLGSDDVMNDILDKLKGPSSQGNESVMNDIMDKLTSQQSSRWIIAIAGMGGIGKTTLAKSIYENPLIVEYFDIRGWATVSQKFDSKRILLQVLDCLINKGSEDSEYEELGQKLYQSLYGRRYLIVMDDILGTDSWDRVKSFFPDNNNGSKVLITTRPSKLALQIDGPDYFQMPFLKLDESWNLLRRCVFQDQGCPPELEEIGKEIAGKCGGLPLSIVVIGGLLAKSKQSRKNWQHVSENLSSIVNLEDDERCFRILKLSYNQLPVHLKPCFLYMAMYPEDDETHVPTLINLWIDEGFVKPVVGKSLETTARVVYLHDLIIRNLILVRKWGPTGRIKRCGIPDLLRDLCIKEAEKYNFFRTTETTPTHNNTEHHDQISWRAQRLPFRLLRILNGYNRSSSVEQAGKVRLEEHFHLDNLRHLFIRAKLPKLEFPPEFYLLWNLRTLIFDKYSSYDNQPVLDIWRMPQLRQVKVLDLLLTDPPPPPPMVLENLETLQNVHNLRLCEEVVERIPNIKKLGLCYQKEEEELSPGDYCLENLCQLHKLEALTLSLRISEKLTLEGTRLGWEEMGTTIGSLPYLEALKLYYYAFVGLVWETVEGGFPSLKYLEIVWFSDLEQWRAEATHFPRLERLDLVFLDKLKEIP